MKTKVVWFIAAFVIAPLLPLCYGQANQLDNRLGYNPGNTQTYTYSVTNSSLKQWDRAIRRPRSLHGSARSCPTAGCHPAAGCATGGLSADRFLKPRGISNSDHNPHRCRKRRPSRVPAGQHQSLDHGSTRKSARNK